MQAQIGGKEYIEKVNKLIKATLAIKDALIKSTDEDEGNIPEKRLKLESAVSIKMEPLDMDVVLVDYS